MIRKILLTTLVSLLLPLISAEVTDQELDAATFALRFHGYSLFPNAIATSDLRLRLLDSNSTFTLFSPPDTLLFSLDLSSNADYYVRSLLLHVSPTRFSMSDLRRLPDKVYIESLLPGQRLAVQKALVLENETIVRSVLIDGIGISVADLFLGTSIAIHGLEGILAAESGWDNDSEHRDFSIGLPPNVSPASSMFNSPAPAISPAPAPIRGITKDSEARKKENGKKSHVHHEGRNQRGFHGRHSRRDNDLGDGHRNLERFFRFGL